MKRQPNIILINCDDLGYGDLGCYGSKVNKTPVLDKMAEEGMLFTDFYMASPVCSPSRGAMLTGCYPPRIGFGSFEGAAVLFPGHRVGLNPDEKTVAALLRDAGYRTMLVGKWHCGDQKEFLPTRHGFDRYYGLPYSNDMGRQAGDGEDRPPLPLMLDEEVLQQQPDQAALTERYTEQAVRFIRENRENPFFLYLAHMHVHLPLYAPKKFLDRSENGPYGAAVACVDWSTGAILEELKTHGLLQDTLIVFTSDNGSRGDHGGSNSPLRGMKTTTWEGGQRVPCLMYWPGRIPTGTKYRDIAASIDLYPTFAALAGAKLPEDRIIDGVDIRMAMFGEGPSPREHFFYYWKDNLEAVREGPWKLHVRKKQEEMTALYHLRDDIGETADLSGRHPEIVSRLQALLQSCREDIGDAATGVVGKNIRPKGVAEDPDTLTHYDPSHPYIDALYDISDRG